MKSWVQQDSAKMGVDCSENRSSQRLLVVEGPSWARGFAYIHCLLEALLSDS